MREIEHIGSAHDDVELELLKVAAMHGWLPGKLAQVDAGADEIVRAYEDVGMRVSYSFAVRDQNRDELIVTVTSEQDRSEFDVVRAAVEDRLRERLGVKIQAEVVAPGALDAWTEVNVAPKLKRFRDER